jgi:hypothetical protein
VTAPETLYRTPNNVYGFRKCCEAIRDNVPIEEVARRYTKLEAFGGKAWFRQPLSSAGPPRYDAKFLHLPARTIPLLWLRSKRRRC